MKFSHESVFSFGYWGKNERNMIRWAGMKSHIIKRVATSLQCAIKQLSKIGFIYFQYFKFWICKARPFNICNKYVFISGGPKTPTTWGLLYWILIGWRGWYWRYVCRVWLKLYIKSIWTEENGVVLLLRIMGEITCRYFCYHYLKMFAVRFVADLS